MGFTSKYNVFYNLFADEIDSNIRSAKIINDLGIINNSEMNLINYLIISMKCGNYLISNQIEYLSNVLLSKSIDYDFKTINSIYYGTQKNDEIFMAILDSYQTHSLCVDIENGRRL